MYAGILKFHGIVVISESISLITLNKEVICIENSCYKLKPYVSSPTYLWQYVWHMMNPE